MKITYIIATLWACGSFQALAQTSTLEECLDMAVQHNTEIKNARLDLRAAESDKKGAFTKYFPQVGAAATGFVGSHDVIRTEITIPHMGALPIGMIKKGAVASLTALQPLYTGGQILNGNKLAKLQSEVRALQLEMTEKDVRQNVQDYFWKLVALRSNLTTLDAVDRQLEEVDKLTSQYVKAGITTRNDLLRVQLKQQEVASQRLTLNNGIEVVRLLLAQLCGADMQTFDITAQNIMEPASPDTYFMSADAAIANREETELTQKAVQASALQVKMERGKQLPSLAVGASAMYYNLMEKNQGNLVGLATLSVPISEWWGGSHNVRKAKVALEQNRNRQRDTQEKLQIDILTAWNSLQEAYAQIEIARKSVEQADENLRLSRDQYNAGTLDMTELLDAVTLYTQSHNTLNSVCANYQSRIADYQRKTR